MSSDPVSKLAVERHADILSRRCGPSGRAAGAEHDVVDVAAEFATMTPHAIEALDGPAELIMIFDRDGQRAHVHRDGA